MKTKKKINKTIKFDKKKNKNKLKVGGFAGKGGGGVRCKAPKWGNLVGRFLGKK